MKYLPYSLYPSEVINLWHVSAYLSSANPRFLTPSEKPKLGKDGATTWKAGAPFAPLPSRGRSFTTSKKFPGPSDELAIARLQGRTKTLAAVHEKQWYSPSNFALLVNEMNVQRLETFYGDFGMEVRQVVHHFFLLLPTEAIFPIRNQSLRVAERDSVIPLSSLELVGKFRQCQPILQCSQSPVRDFDDVRYGRRHIVWM